MISVATDRPPLQPRSATPLLLLLAGTLFAGIGNGISMIAIPWLVLERTGSAADASIVAAGGAVPLLLSTLLSGTIVDRFGRRLTSMFSDAFSALSVMAIPLLDQTVGLTILLLVICAAFGSVFDPAGLTAREAMLPEAIQRSGWSSDRGNSLYEAINNVAYLVGPGLGGVLISTVGATNTLYFTGFGFACSILAIAGVRMANTAHAIGTAHGGFWTNTREGVGFVWNDPLLRTIALLNTGAVAVYVPIQGVILPAHFIAEGSPSYLGWVIAAISLGGLFGALAYGHWAQLANRRHMLIVSFGSFMLTTIGLALLPSVTVMIGLCLLMGLAYGPQAPIVNHAMQVRTPEHLRGRVIGVMSSVAFAAGPLGYLIVGPLIDQLGLRTSFLALAALLIPLTAVVILSRSLHLVNDDMRPAGD